MRSSRPPRECGPVRGCKGPAPCSSQQHAARRPSASPASPLRPAPARRWDVHCAPPRATRRCLQASSLPARAAQVACRERRYPPPPPPSGSSGAFRQAHYGRAHAPTAPLPVPDQFRSLATAWADLNRAGMSWADLLNGHGSRTNLFVRTISSKSFFFQALEIERQNLLDRRFNLRTGETPEGRV
jgi:hypothetical protein